MRLLNSVILSVAIALIGRQIPEVLMKFVFITTGPTEDQTGAILFDK